MSDRDLAWERENDLYNRYDRIGKERPAMIIKTRKLPATQTEGERMRATADTGASLTLPYPYGATDPHKLVADALTRAGVDGNAHRAERTGDGHTFRVIRREAE